MHSFFYLNCFEFVAKDKNSERYIAIRSNFLNRFSKYVSGICHLFHTFHVGFVSLEKSFSELPRHFWYKYSTDKMPLFYGYFNISHKNLISQNVFQNGITRCVYFQHSFHLGYIFICFALQLLLVRCVGWGVLLCYYFVWRVMDVWQNGTVSSCTWHVPLSMIPAAVSLLPWIISYEQRKSTSSLLKRNVEHLVGVWAQI